MRFNQDLCVLENTMFWPHAYNVKSIETVEGTLG
jgi:hypothetical protein